MAEWGQGEKKQSRTRKSYRTACSLGSKAAVELQAGLSWGSGLWALTPIPIGPLGAQVAEVEWTLTCEVQYTVAFSQGNSEFSSDLWSQWISSANEVLVYPSRWKIQSSLLQSRNMKQIISKCVWGKGQGVLMNLPALPTWKNTSNLILSNALVHFNIALGWREGLRGLWKLALSI